MVDHEAPDPADDVDIVGRTPQGELSRRLRLLLDIVLEETDRPVLFSDISAAMTTRGVKLSRARWNYMRDGNGRLIPDRTLLVALADFFNVDPDFLLSVEDMETLELTASQLELVKALRAERVKWFTAKTLGDVSPQTLDMTIDYLDQDASLHSEGGSAADSADSSDGPHKVQ
ncbi:hypothetical protein [Arthrobacter sp. AQ5-05]|uniref:hypothetical protein n=1 Tax=Arthrobacter sp. AQ5-05 TaxID=2184581 RepID=UPI0018A75F71|nr:hypothetical protein [Arthrobacter sp. AQ5-05]